MALDQTIRVEVSMKDESFTREFVLTSKFAVLRQNGGYNGLNSKRSKCQSW